MRKTVVLFGFLAAMAAGLVLADIDLSDFDQDLMRDMDNSNKDLEPVINAKNAATATEDAKFILEGLQWTEKYFASKGNAADAVKYSQDAQALTNSILKSLSQNDFDNAASTARELSRSCKICHETYKPLNLTR
jgi:lipopolysaccharide export LptBFGC system permease protein LptF